MTQPANYEPFADILKRKEVIIRRCKDCRYCKNNFLLDYGYATCNRPEVNLHNAEWLAGSKRGRFCDHARNYGPCGIEGKYFEKKSRFTFLKKIFIK